MQETCDFLPVKIESTYFILLLSEPDTDSVSSLSETDATESPETESEESLRPFLLLLLSPSVESERDSEIEFDTDASVSSLLDSFLTPRRFDFLVAWVIDAVFALTCS